MSGSRALGLACVALALGCAIAGCNNGSGSSGGRRSRRSHSSGGDATSELAEDGGRCDTSGVSTEVSEYDTSGDETPDVRRVFHRFGSGAESRLVLACREADLNGDGTKDVVRYYNDDGRPLREESDRDFDGSIDTITVFQNGRIVRMELDENGDGRVDAKVYYDDTGAAVRTERDTAGRSTEAEWHPDRWEYFEDGRVVRMGTDIDGDGNVDRWDRDHERAPPPGEEGAAATAAASSS